MYLEIHNLNSARLNVYYKTPKSLQDAGTFYRFAKRERKGKIMKKGGGIEPHSVSLKDSRTIKNDAHFSLKISICKRL